MNKIELSNVISEALCRYAWRGSSGMTLPDHIANAIAIRQPEEEGPVIGIGSAHYVKLRNEIKDAAKTLNERDAEILNLRNLKRLYGEEIETLRRHEQTHIESLGRLRSDLEREKASNLDARTKLEAAEKEIARQLTSIERTTAELNKCSGKLEEARAAQPHLYHASTPHMGDCLICGDKHDAPQHKAANWKERALAAEHNHQITKDRLTGETFRAEMAESNLKELTGVADEFEKENRTLRNDRDVAMRKLEEAKDQLKDMTFRAEVAENRADNCEARVAAVKKAMQS